MNQALSAQQRDRFQQLMWPLIADVLRFATYLTRDPDEAEDLAQETMMRAMRNIEKFEEGTDAKAWLLTIERRLFIDRYRVQKNRPFLSFDQQQLPEPAMEDSDREAGLFDEAWNEPEDLLRRFTDEQLVDELRDLPDDLRWTLLLVDVEGMEHASAADLLNVPVGTIKSRAHRGRALLRDKLYRRAQIRGWVVAGEGSHS